jgi:hypothetical protein
VKRPRAEILVAAAVVIAGALAAGLLLDYESFRDYADRTRTVGVGDCLDVRKEDVDCDDPAYFYRVAAEVRAPSACAGAHDAHLTLHGDHYCLDTKPLVRR